HPAPPDGSATAPVRDGDIVIAALTSCTNTSNPSVMIGAGLIARRAVALGLKVPAHVKTSLAPGSKVVTAYLERAGLLDPLARLGFAVVGYGCTTCIGNSGPLPPAIAEEVRAHDRYVVTVLSGNRNFEGRVHNLARANYLASPMLVVAYALAGRIDVDLTREPLGTASDGHPVYLRDLWPPAEEVRRHAESDLDPAMFREKYAAIEVGDAHWESLPTPQGTVYSWEAESTYIREPPYLRLGPPWLPGPSGLLAEEARALAVFGDQISTDHISPAGEIPEDSPAGAYLRAHGVPPEAFNTYGSRRGNDEVMVRGTFANVRIRNQLVAPREGGYTLGPDGTVTSIYEAAEGYRSRSVPLLVLAGANYGQGSSRDWAAKGPRLLGVGAVLAQSFERIHRSNLVDMGVLPLSFPPGQGVRSLGLTGRERFRLSLADGDRLGPRARIRVVAEGGNGPAVSFDATAELHSEIEVAYYTSGGVLPYVMRERYGLRPGPPE
ncbi:MAG: aconitase family protein, partial [Thermoplasmata archaeon]